MGKIDPSAPLSKHTMRFVSAYLRIGADRSEREAMVLRHNAAGLTDPSATLRHARKEEGKAARLRSGSDYFRRLATTTRPPASEGGEAK
ncbi:hypothetical protein [Roseomonas indoligenes]|uniref:Uncharacterized protein n=1 Tax=Roseomonas indoligenes TaxID=2820811 RepID=A0A940MYV1_9PROT|nr:hypothetical protein [Pararoseomonas indoligenes]MBP0492230.1 hypothetical protein [Pararoseomonas indoligenes]